MTEKLDHEKLAEAAPQMYEALEKILHEVEFADYVRQETIDAADDAIKKARGE